MDGLKTRSTVPASGRPERHPAITAARILVVDDEAPNVAVLTRILERDGFRDVVGTTSPHDALRQIAERPVDLVMLDQHMPELDGLELLTRLRSLLSHEAYLPIVFLSGDSSSALRRRALGAGATDFIAKPFDPMEVVLRIGNLLETRRLHLLQQQQNVELERRVLERTAQLEESQARTAGTALPGRGIPG